MKTLGTIITVVALVVLGFLLPCYGNRVEERITELEAQVNALESQVQLLILTTKRILETVEILEDQIADLKAKSTLPLKIAYINAEEAFTVFTDAG